MSDYEPPAEMVEALREEWNISGLMAAKVLRRQHEREAGLLEALDYYAMCGHGLELVAKNALAAHAKLDAPKVPTPDLSAIFAESQRRVRAAIEDSEKYVREALAAVEREERGA